jgi:hypothetical protein
LENLFLENDRKVMSRKAAGPKTLFKMSTYITKGSFTSTFVKRSEIGTRDNSEKMEETEEKGSTKLDE